MATEIKKYIKNGEVAHTHFIKTETVKDDEGNDKQVNIDVYGASEKEWRDNGYLPVEEYYAGEIAKVKKQLADTDYIPLKGYEGYDVDSLYPNWKEDRAALRNLVNSLEAELANILSEE